MQVASDQATPGHAPSTFLDSIIVPGTQGPVQAILSHIFGSSAPAPFTDSSNVRRRRKRDGRSPVARWCLLNGHWSRVKARDQGLPSLGRRRCRRLKHYAYCTLHTVVRRLLCVRTNKVSSVATLKSRVVSCRFYVVTEEKRLMSLKGFTPTETWGRQNGIFHGVATPIAPFPGHYSYYTNPGDTDLTSQKLYLTYSFSGQSANMTNKADKDKYPQLNLDNTPLGNSDGIVAFMLRAEGY